MNQKNTRRGFTQNVVICSPCRESVAAATKEGLNWKKTLWPLLPRLTAVLPPQGREITTHAFTLIELLVVVLIIGILAAMAVPQYQKAVEKSKATEALTLLKTVTQATQAYYLANGQYPTKFEQLDIEIPFSKSTKWHTNYILDTKSNSDWSLQLYSGESKHIMMGRISGPYTGAGFYVDLKPNGNYTITCVEDFSQNTTSFAEGAYCKKILNKSFGNDSWH